VRLTSSKTGGWGVICCGHVVHRQRKVRLVCHRHEGKDWQFMCGDADHDTANDGNFVMIGVLLDFDPSLDELADLPAGWEAVRRDPGASWIRTKFKPDHSN
jgi:hypothetical protein